MNRDDLSSLYRGYVDCLNRQDWGNLDRHVAGDVRYNGKAMGLARYRSMLERDFRAIPDLRFHIALLLADPPHVAVRLKFDCTPRGDLFGIPVNGRRVQFDENVFYAFEDGRIHAVWSIIDKSAIAEQL